MFCTNRKRSWKDREGSARIVDLQEQRMFCKNWKYFFTGSREDFALIGETTKDWDWEGFAQIEDKSLKTGKTLL